MIFSFLFFFFFFSLFFFFLKSLSFFFCLSQFFSLNQTKTEELQKIETLSNEIEEKIVILSRNNSSYCQDSIEKMNEAFLIILNNEKTLKLLCFVWDAILKSDYFILFYFILFYFILFYFIHLKFPLLCFLIFFFSFSSLLLSLNRS